MIIVFGSMNMDMGIKLKRLPSAGETILTDTYHLSPGGKGGNQALAAARFGSKVAIVGKVGSDDMGYQLTDTLKKNGVMTSGVVRTDNQTGAALLINDKNGNKQTITMLGANAECLADQVPDEILTPKNMLLLQMELPLEETVKLVARAKAAGVTTMLNMAPAITVPGKMLVFLDYLVVNSIEAQQIAKKLDMEVNENAPKLAHALAQAGNLTCIMTLGSRGSVAIKPDGTGWHVPAMKLEDHEVVDIMGAGDCYCGTLAAALYEGDDMPLAMRKASIAGSLACKKQGAQESYPYLGDIEELLEAFPQARDISV